MLSSVTMIACQRYKVVDPKLGLSCPTPQGLQEPFMCVISPIKVVIASSNMSAEDGMAKLNLASTLRYLKGGSGPQRHGGQQTVGGHRGDVLAWPSFVMVCLLNECFGWITH